MTRLHLPRPAPTARAVPPGATAAATLAAGVARPWSTRRPVSVIGPPPPYDAFGVAATCSATGPHAAPEGGVGAPSRLTARGTQLNRVRPSRALGLRAAAVRHGPEAALGRRDATRRGFTGRDGEGRGPPPARPVKSGSSTAPPPGAEGGALSCSSSASSPWSSSRSTPSARSCRSTRAPARSGARTAPAGAVERRRPRTAPARGARRGTGAPHGACQGPLLGPPSGTRRVAPRSPMGSIGLAPADMKRSALLRAGPARLRGIASASLTLAAASPAA